MKDLLAPLSSNEEITLRRLAMGSTSQHKLPAEHLKRLDRLKLIEASRGGYRLTPLGIIYDSTTPVGRVHLGVVYELEACDTSFTLNEPDLMSARWVRIEGLREFRDRMETWSQILFDNHIGNASAVC